MRSRALRYRLYRNAAMSCFPDGRSAPPTLSYASPQSWTYGAAITTLSPTTTGATSFAVQSGALPTGISLDAGTGVLSGTPTQSKVAANVEITATGPGGSIAATINIAVPSPLYTSLVDYWNLDEASGTRVGSHAGLDLTDNNTVTSQATGGPDGGRCAQFTAANSETLTRASEAALQIGASDFTLAVWAYLDSIGAFNFMVGKGDVNTSEYSLFNSTGYGNLRLVVDSVAGDVSNSASLSAGSWKYCVGYADIGAGKIYVQTNNAAASETVYTKGPATNASAFCLGDDAPSTHGPFDGRMAYAGLWKRKLTANERTWLYNSGAGRAYSALATYDGG